MISAEASQKQRRPIHALLVYPLDSTDGQDDQPVVIREILIDPQNALDTPQDVRTITEAKRRYKLRLGKRVTETPEEKEKKLGRHGLRLGKRDERSGLRMGKRASQRQVKFEQQLSDA